MNDEPAGRPGPSLVQIYLLFVVVRFLASLLISEPVILPDELTYKTMAQGFHSAGDFAASGGLKTNGAMTNIVYVLYPLLLSAPMAFGANFMAAAKLLNALLINAAIFPFFILLRDFLPRRRAVWAAALPLLLPIFGYSSFLMAENAFIPLAAAALCFLYRLFTDGKALDGVLAAGALALLALTKPQAGAFLIGFLAAAIVLIVSGLIGNRDPGRARKILTGLGALAATALAAGLLLGLAWPGLGGRLRAILRSVAGLFGFSLTEPAGGSPLHAGLWARAGAAHAAAVLFLFLIPLLTVFWIFLKSLRSTDRKRAVLATLVLSFFLAASLGTIFLTATFSPREAFGRLHGRFYAATFAFLLIAWSAFAGDLVWTKRRKAVLGTAAAGTLLLGVWSLPGYLAGLGPVLMAVDYPELGWAAFAGAIGPAVAVLLFLGLVVSVLASGKARNYAAFILAIALLSNAAQYRTFVRSFQPAREAWTTARSFAAGHIGNPEARVAVFSQDPLPRLLLAFWNPYRYTRSGKIQPNGRLTRAMIPAETEYVVLFGNVRPDFRPIRSYSKAGCSILVLTERTDVLGDFVGIYRDAPGWAWTGETFAYLPSGPFRTLTLSLNERKPYFPESLEVETDQGTKQYRLNDGLETIELPYSSFYRFRLDRVFSPRSLGLNKDDPRALGISLREAFIQN